MAAELEILSSKSNSFVRALGPGETSAVPLQLLTVFCLQTCVSVCFRANLNCFAGKSEFAQEFQILLVSAVFLHLRLRFELNVFVRLEGFHTLAVAINRLSCNGKLGWACPTLLHAHCL